MVKMDSSCKSVSVFLLYLICFFHRMMMLTFTTCSDAAMVAARMEVEEVERKMRRCSAEQSSALLEFKSYFSLSTDPLSCPRPPPTVSWKEGTDCCSLWDGITCDNETGQVVGIHLNCGWLQGNIPPNTTVFNHFPHLQKLHLAHNYFGGSRIPSSFGHLSRLTDLILYMSEFSGEIPMELSYLTQLMRLDLGVNNGLRFKKTGFQLLVQNLTKIRELHLNSIKISSAVPISLLNLSSSNILELDGCELHGQLPDGVFNLPYLEEFDAGFNSLLTGNFPKFINSSNSLRILELDFTSFAGQLPDSIGNLGSLEWLHAAHCNIYGAIPASLGNLTSVMGINLSNNSLSGPLPLGLTGLPNLQSLVLNHNYITGPLPSRFTGLPNLQSLALRYNHITGPLPSRFTGLPNLQSLLLDHNYITGTIPPELFALPSLSKLELSYNMFTGHVNEINSSSLRFINLQYNKLTGTLGSSMFKLELLTYLTISSNNFSGDINMLCNQNYLKVLDVSNNGFSGVFPKCVGNLNELVVLDLGSNYFSGIVPDTFMRDNNLAIIKLYGNGFQGPVPKSLVNCTGLIVLDLGRNNFSDKYPQWLENLTYLRVLILRANRFHGPISTSKTKHPFPSLQVMDLSENCFTGPLPTTYFRNFVAMINDSKSYEPKYIGLHDSYYLDSLTMVIKGSVLEMERVLAIFRAIDLSRNKFEGEIPEIIGELTQVHGLNLSHNSLTGRIPKSLEKLTMLEWLDLSSNKLVGEIPKQLTALNFLGVLNLSHNQLAGRIPEGAQFDTFSNDSYVGNLGLCGRPLSKSCSNPHAPQPLKEKASQSSDGFDWEVILSGYGCGLVLGLVMGYLMFSTGKPRRVMRMIEGAENKCREWQKRQSQGQGRKCRRNYGRH